MSTIELGLDALLEYPDGDDVTDIETDPCVTGILSLPETSSPPKQAISQIETLDPIGYHYGHRTIPLSIAALRDGVCHDEEAVEKSFRIGTSYLADDNELFDNETFASWISDFHKLTSDRRSLAVNPPKVVYALQRLQNHPDIVAELLDRQFATGWRPDDSTREATTHLQSLLDELEYKYEQDSSQKVRRIANFAGRILSQRLGRRHYLRRQGRQPQEPGEAILSEISAA